jgi:glycosyltransferase involved in cell wall biosynthesis
MVKYLPKFGWQPYVLGGGLKRDSNPYIFKARYFDPFQFGQRHRESMKKYLGINKRTLNIENQIAKHNSPKSFWPLSEVRMPDKYMFWIWPAVKLGKKLLRSEKFDIIYSSSGPASSAIVASILQSHAQLPWVAEFRDLWSDNHVDRRKAFISKIDSYLEYKCLENCSALVTVSDLLKRDLLDRHRKTTYVIYNGYDEDDYPPMADLTRKLTLTYTGRIYAGKRDPTVLFKAIATSHKTKKINPDILQVQFYGSGQEIIKALTKKYGVEHYVYLGGVVSYKESLLRQCESWILLLLEWDNPLAKGVLTGKLFEYLGAKRPILSIGYKEGSLGKLLTETRTGVVLNDPKDIEHFLLSCIEKYSEQDWSIGFVPNEEAIAMYSRRNAAEKLSKVFSSLA